MMLKRQIVPLMVDSVFIREKKPHSTCMPYKNAKALPPQA